MYFVSIILIIIVFAVGNTTQSSLLTEFTAYYGLSTARQGLISSAVSLGMFIALALLLTGAIRLKKPLILVAAAFTVSAMFMLLGMRVPYPLLLCIYLIIGVSYGLIDSSASSTVADLYSDGKSQIKMGLAHSFFGVGGVLGPIAITALKSGGTEWNGILRIFAAFSAVVFAVSIFAYLPRRNELDGRVQPTARITLTEMKGLLNRRNGFFIAAVGLKGAQEVCIAFWIAKYITEGLGSPILGPLAISAMWLGSSVSRLVIPRLKFNIAGYIKYSMLLSAAVFIVALTFPSAILTGISALIVGLTSGAVVPMGIAELCGRHRENTLAASSVTLITIYSGQLIFPLLAGLLFPNLLYAGIIMAIVCGLLSSLFAFSSELPTGVMK